MSSVTVHSKVLKSTVVAPLRFVSGLLACLTLLTLVGTGCEAGTKDSTRERIALCRDRPVQMAVASSLREMALSLRERFAASDPSLEIDLIFGASSSHARQLAMGAPIDLIVSADAEIVDELVRREILNPTSRLEFAHGQLSVLAAPGWAQSGSLAEAVGSSDLRSIAIPSAAVPLGRYARAWIDGQELRQTLQGKIVVTEHARATLAAVDSGLVDLAIVYRSELRLAKKAMTLALIDPTEHPTIRYVAGRATASPDCASIDRALAGWRHPAMQRALSDAGFILASREVAL